MVELYIFSRLENQYKQVDLYGDETITIETSMQEIRQLSETSTDYSQNFKVPPTPNNESLFRHWYDSSVQVQESLTNVGFDNRFDIPAILYYDGELFRRGVVKINNVEVLRGTSLNYDISFFGRLRTLISALSPQEKAFNNEKLYEMLELNTEVPYERDYATIKNLISNSNEGADLMYPLIANSGSWTFHQTPNNLDISKHQGAIKVLDLFPAISLPAMFRVIQDRYNVSFTGNFLTDPRFTRAYCLFGGRPTTATSKQQIMLEFNNGTITSPVSNAFEKVSGDDTIIRYTGIKVAASSFGPAILSLEVTADPSTLWSIKTFLNGGRINRITGQPLPTFSNDSITRVVFADYFTGIETGFEGDYTFEITLSNDLPFSVSATLNYQGDVDVLSTDVVTPSALLSLTDLAPDILVSDFFKGVLNMFNLTCYSLKEDEFVIEDSEYWYSQGKKVNIDPYVEKKWNVGAVPVYNEVSFKYKESKSVLNYNYRNTVSGGREYGNLDYTNPDITRGEKIEVSVPFENLRFVQMKTNTHIGPRVGYLIDENAKPYAPTVCILYHTKLQTGIDTIYITNGTSPESITSYNAFGQDIFILGNWYSLNWGLETSIETPLEVPNTLFNSYYKPKVDTAYNIRTRLVTVNAKLPTPILNNLELNDGLILEGELYRINKFSTDLYTGISTFELLRVSSEQLQTAQPTVVNTSVTCNSGGEFTSTFSGGSGAYLYTAIATTLIDAITNVQGTTGTRYAVTGTTYNWTGIADGSYYVTVLDTLGNVGFTATQTVVDCVNPPVYQCTIISPTAVWVSN